MSEDLLDKLRKPTEEERQHIRKELHVGSLISFNLWKLLSVASLLFIPLSFWDNYLVKHDLHLFLNTLIYCVVLTAFFYFLNTFTKSYRFGKAIRKNRLYVDNCTCLSTQWVDSWNESTNYTESNGQITVKGSLTGDVSITANASNNVMKVLKNSPETPLLLVTDGKLCIVIIES